MRIHFPSEKCICSVCGKGFLENYVLKCHLLKVHGVTVESKSLNGLETDNLMDVAERINVEPQTGNKLAADTESHTDNVTI